VVDFGELIEIRTVGFIASVIIGQKVDELEGSLGERDVTLVSFLNYSQAGLCQLPWWVSHIDVGVLGLNG